MLHKAIAKTRKMFVHTVMSVFNTTDEHGMHWDGIEELSNDVVFAFIIPERAAAEKVMYTSDYDHVQFELEKTVVFSKFLWQECADIVRESDSTLVSSVSFIRGCFSSRSQLGNKGAMCLH